MLPLLVVLVTALMASLALPLGPLLRAMPPLKAYAIDITGSMIGIAAFTLLAFLGTGPTAWFILTGALLLLLALGAGPTPWSFLGGFAVILVIIASFAVGQASLDVWSPVLPDLGVWAGPDPGVTRTRPMGTPRISCPWTASPISRSGRPSRPRPATSIARSTSGSRTGRSTACS